MSHRLHPFTDSHIIILYMHSHHMHTLLPIRSDLVHFFILCPCIPLSNLSSLPCLPHCLIICFLFPGNDSCSFPLSPLPSFPLVRTLDVVAASSTEYKLWLNGVGLFLDIGKQRAAQVCTYATLGCCTQVKALSTCNSGAATVAGQRFTSKSTLLYMLYIHATNYILQCTKV